MKIQWKIYRIAITFITLFRQVVYTLFTNRFIDILINKFETRMYLMQNAFTICNLIKISFIHTCCSYINNEPYTEQIHDKCRYQITNEYIKPFETLKNKEKMNKKVADIYPFFLNNNNCSVLVS